MTASDGKVPKNAADQMSVARELLARLYMTQAYPDLFAAVLACVHVVDWHFTTAPDRQITDAQRGELRSSVPEYETLCDLANALKHGLFPRSSRQPSEARLLVLKRIDAWSGDDEDDAMDGWHHLGLPDYWIVRHGSDRRHSVYLLCKRFLDAMEAMSGNAKP